MNNVVKHRGPDDEGYYLWNPHQDAFLSGVDSVDKIKMSSLESIKETNFDKPILAFGHRRLSIIDLSELGHQPMSYDGFVLIFNGEIYNYIELRKELISLGQTFESSSDTEVLIKAYKHWGEKCVEYFDGMWSFALWDKSNKKLFCSRDRFGEKPFHYYYDGKSFVFGSEIKQVLSYGIPFKINEDLIYKFLKLGGFINRKSETYFENIYSLEQGKNIIIKINSENGLDFEILNYYDLKKKSIKENSFTETSNKLGEILTESVLLRLRSDVRIGSCLSGGLDSSSLVQIISDLNGSKPESNSLSTFSAMYDESPEVDERYYSDIVNETTKSRGVSVKPNSIDLINDFTKMIWHQEEPFPTLSIFASWTVMKEANKAGVKVMFDGQGGDETLLGYSYHFVQYLQDLLENFKIIDFIKMAFLISKNNNMNYHKVQIAVIRKTISSRLNFLKRIKRRLTIEPHLNKTFVYQNKALTNDRDKVNNLNELELREFDLFLKDLLRYEDRNSMAHSIETRLPFLSKAFVEYSISIPHRMRLNEGWSKAPLREFMKHSLSEKVIYRKNKLGFSVPQSLWIQELEPYIKSLLNEKILSEKYFNIEWIRKNYSNPNETERIFKFLMIENWLRTFNSYV